MTDPYLPPEQRRAILADYGQRYGLTVFVESGTADGSTPAVLMGQFERLYTIEVDADLFAAARQRFAGTNVTCLHGDSGVLLEAVLREVGDTPALLWLDGHRCSEPVDATDTPILAELAAVFATNVPHVVLIDDARLFDGMPLHSEQRFWPHIGEVADLAILNDYSFECTDDIIRCVPLASVDFAPYLRFHEGWHVCRLYSEREYMWHHPIQDRREAITKAEMDWLAENGRTFHVCPG